MQKGKRSFGNTKRAIFKCPFVFPHRFTSCFSALQALYIVKKGYWGRVTERRVDLVIFAAINDNPTAQFTRFYPYCTEYPSFLKSDCVRTSKNRQIVNHIPRLFCICLLAAMILLPFIFMICFCFYSTILFQAHTAIQPQNNKFLGRVGNICGRITLETFLFTTWNECGEKVTGLCINNA